MSRRFLPLGAFLLLLALLAAGLTLEPRTVASPLVGKPLPAFRLAQLAQPQAAFSPQDLLGEVWLLNVWASWCAACRDEHPLLVELARDRGVPLIGLNYKDQPRDAKTWLARYGDPYRLSVTDHEGRVGIDFGVRALPETFVIDRRGIVRHKHTGPITREALEVTILPLLGRLKAS